MTTITAAQAKDLLVKSWTEFNKDQAPRLGAALAYYTVLSLAPLLILLEHRQRLNDSFLVQPRRFRDLPRLRNTFKKRANRVLAVKTGDLCEFIQDLLLIASIRGSGPLPNGFDQFSSCAKLSCFPVLSPTMSNFDG